MRGTSVRVGPVARVALPIVSLLGATLIVLAPGRTDAATVTQVITASADTYVDSSTPSTALGTLTSLIADSSPTRYAFLRFNLTAVTGTITAATLRLHAQDSTNAASPVGGTVRKIVSNSWSEAATTYANRPSTSGTTVGSFGAVARNTWYQLNALAAVAPGIFVNLSLTSSNSNGAIYDTREAGANAPQLVLTIQTQTSTATPASTTPPTPTSPAGTPQATTPPSGIVIAAAGDMVCAPSSAVTSTACRQLSVSNLVKNDTSVQQFLALGDLQYPNGELDDFQVAYGPSYGRFLGITRPAPGNHEYQLGNANGYYAYFGAQAGDPTKGYYSFDVGTTWHIVALNSNCTFVSCAAGAAQEKWLRADLLASNLPCTIAYFHHPRWTSASRGDNTNVDPLWRAIADDGGELVLTGHEHVFERFAPMNASGAADANGVRAMVVGTGGASIGSFGTTPHVNSLVRLVTFGVLKLTLAANSYSWQMVNENGAVLDSGTGTCH